MERNKDGIGKRERSGRQGRGGTRRDETGDKSHEEKAKLRRNKRDKTRQQKTIQEPRAT
jgi:hypothetical protein